MTSLHIFGLTLTLPFGALVVRGLIAFVRRGDGIADGDVERLLRSPSRAEIAKLLGEHDSRPTTSAIERTSQANANRHTGAS